MPPFGAITYGCAFLQRACPLWLRWLRGLLLMWLAFVRSCSLFPCISYGKKGMEVSGMMFPPCLGHALSMH
jgi:hypothetical protein